MNEWNTVVPLPAMLVGRALSDYMDNVIELWLTSSPTCSEVMQLQNCLRAEVAVRGPRFEVRGSRFEVRGPKSEIPGLRPEVRHPRSEVGTSWRQPSLSNRSEVRPRSEFRGSRSEIRGGNATATSIVNFNLLILFA